MEKRKPSENKPTIQFEPTQTTSFQNSEPVEQIEQKRNNEVQQSTTIMHYHRKFTITGRGGSLQNSPATSKTTTKTHQLTLYAKNNLCGMCNLSVFEDKAPLIYFQECDHVVHLKHFTLSKMITCPVCFKGETNIRIETLRDDKKMEIEDTEPEYDDEDFTPMNYVQIYDIFKTTEPKGKDYILKSKIPFKKFVDNDVTIFQLYYEVDIKTWQDLLDIGFFDHSYLIYDKGFTDIKTLVRLYAVKKEHIEKDLNLTLSKLISNRIEPDEILMLGYTIKDMEAMFSKKNELFAKYINMFDCSAEKIRSMGFKKEHLFKYQLSSSDVRWTRDSVQKAFAASSLELTTLGFVAKTKPPARKKPKDTEADIFE